MATTEPASEFVSNPISWGSLQQSPGGTLVTNSRAGATLVITFIGLVNVSSNNNDAITIQRASDGWPFHSGYVGSGSYDRFPLTCEVALQTGDALEAAAVGGSWGVLVTGHYVPAVVTS